MLRTAFRWGIVTVALAAPPGAACIDYHTAQECQYIGTCPLDAGDGSDATMNAANGGDH